MWFDVGMFQEETEKKKKSRSRVHRCGGSGRRVISENGNPEGRLRTIHVLGLYL